MGGTRARAVGFNHVALEVGDIDEALEFYGRLIEFKLRGKSENMAFIDLGDQFLALQKGRRQAPDDGRHFGLVVTLNLGIGQQTPPVASVLVTACSVAKAEIWEVSKVNVYFILALLIVLLVVTYVPVIPLSLVEIFYR